MATQILDLYKAQQSELGVDKIKTDPASSAARNTPYTTNDLQKIDAGVISEEALKIARGGVLNDPATGRARDTPLSTDDLQSIDRNTVTEDRLKIARGGVLNTKKYSDTVRKNG